MIALLLALLAQDGGNRLKYLDEADPYYVGRGFAKLTTPQWVGEEGVEAVVVLAIDDMRGHEKWETYLRPILERLKKIDGRAPVSIMTCTIDPNHPHLQKWLKEGVSIEVHTVDHPCPLLKDGDLAKAKSTYDRCVDLMNLVPNNRPVAFRMPCCDSLNTPSPRFYAEIFNKESPGGHFLSIDTSVFTITTSADTSLPKELTTDPDGKEKFRKYLPFPSFVNTIEDYPYPYVIGKLCWEFPCIVPSDWEAQNLNKPFAAQTVEDMKAALDGVVAKQGTFNFVFHPHGWIKAEQVVELIDHAVEKHGKKVKFLTFREAEERLRKNLMYGSGLRRAGSGTDQHIRILDINNDGYMDVVTLDREVGHHTKIWQPATRTWKEIVSPLIDGGKLLFGVNSRDGFATAFGPDRAWAFNGTDWEERPAAKLPAKGRLMDVDADGFCELVSESGQVYSLDKDWSPTRFSLPVPLSYSVRFVDLNGDGRLDVVASNESGWGVYLWKDFMTGWEAVATGKPGDPGSIPLITRGATNNGVWFHSNHLWIQNEDTAKMPNLVDRRSYAELLQR